MTLDADSAITSIIGVTGGAEPTLGNNVVLLDQNTTTLDLTLSLTETSTLADGNTVSVDFDVAARRTNGNSKTIYVDAMDSNGNIVTRFVLGDFNAFGNAASDRQRPGYATVGEGNLTFGAPPGAYWWGGDSSPAEFDATRDAHMSLTIRESSFDFSTTNRNGISFSATGVSNYGGGSIADIAEMKLTSFGTSYGMYFDNLKVEGVIEDPTVLLGDVNLNGVVDFLDINPFIGVLSSATFQAEADCDENGVVNFLDIAAFIAILSGS